MQDFLVEQDNHGQFDFVVDSDNRRFKTVDGFETAVKAQVFLNKRASKDNISNPLFRGGWLGNLFWKNQNFEQGSLLFIKNQARLTKLDLNEAKAFIDDAMKYFTDNQMIQKATSSIDNTAVYMTLEIDGSNTNRYATLWRNTNDF